MGRRHSKSSYGDYKKATRRHREYDYGYNWDEFDINRVGLSSHS